MEPSETDLMFFMVELRDVVEADGVGGKGEYGPALERVPAKSFDRFSPSSVRRVETGSLHALFRFDEQSSKAVSSLSDRFGSMPPRRRHDSQAMLTWYGSSAVAALRIELDSTVARGTWS